MGIIRIEIAGSFRDKGVVTFSAQNYGHTDAVECAIKYLQELHPKALAQDLSQASNNDEPVYGFGKTIKEKLTNLNTKDDDSLEDTFIQKL